MERGLKHMLKVNSLIRENTIFSDRYFILRNGYENPKIPFPIEEKYRDLLQLIISLHFIETQHPTETELVLETRYDKEFNQIIKDVEELYNILTFRNMKINVIKNTGIGSQKTFEYKHNKNTTLFSGGVDSVSTAIKQKNENIELLHIASNKNLFGKIKRIINQIDYDNQNVYCINSRIRSSRNRTAISNTRGWLYLTAGHVVNQSLGGKKITFGENGAQLLDIAFGYDVYKHSRATANTNIRYLKMISDLLNRFDNIIDTEINFENINLTKSELMARYLTPTLFSNTWSCYDLRRSQQCGTCWNCFITKMSAVAIGIDPHLFDAQHDSLIDEPKERLTKSNQNIIYDLLTFYHSVITEDADAVEILSDYDDVIEKPYEMARKFGLDIFLGVSKLLERTDKRNGLGKKAEMLLKDIDINELINHNNYLSSIGPNDF